ncbi:MAG TPA: FAD-dependent oxidoreductase [Stellaceae bacterium]|nr:FAD-dependent oxidoreductase [Stellaceae bacterium]
MLPFAITPSPADASPPHRVTPVELTRPPAVAVIGAGFSGTLLALHLLRRCPDPVRIHLIERSPRFGRGLAYSTGNLNHVLNVPTSRMSAFHDRPDDFLDWLRAEGGIAAAVTPHCFVARKVFGDYVRHHLKEEFRRAAGRRGRLVLTRGEVLDLRVARSGITLDIDRDRRIEADIAVLAVGNVPPEPPPIADRRFYDSARYRPDPWAADALTGLDPDDAVMLIGTGLTMVDTVVSLLDRGHRGPIHALSRRGLLPRRHAAAPSPAGALIERPLPTTAAGLTRVLREEIAALAAQGGDWRTVIDGLRPATQDIWQAMPAEERARFIRHLRPWWDVHRHRMPPEVADRIEAAIARGQLTTAATRIRRLEAVPAGVEVAHQPRGRGPLRHLVVQRVINCSGPGCDYDRIADPLVRALLARGDIRPDRHRLGLDVSTSCALRNRHGEIWQRFYAVGPVTRPAFWEVTSVPDIRRQCEALAAHLAARLASARPGHAEAAALRQPAPAVAEDDDGRVLPLCDEFADHAHWA